MAHHFKVTLAFACLSCRHDNSLERAVQSDSPDEEVVVQTATASPLICTACKKAAVGGTQVRVKVDPISTMQYATWIQAHRENL